MLYGCPHCGKGSIFLESYKYDSYWFIELYCLSCRRTWTPRTLSELWKGYSPEAAKRRKAKIGRMLITAMKTIPGHLTDL